MAVTIKDLSAYCGLSISTISKALNNYTDVSDKTRERVQHAARELGYYPNSLARALKTNRTYNIGVLFVDENESGLTHNYFSAVLDSFKTEVEKRGYDITFINHNIGRNAMTYLEHCRYRNVDGVCVACVDFFSPEVIELVKSGLPIVSIDHIFNNKSCIVSENSNGMRALVHHVYRHGHRKIAYIHGPQSSVSDSRISSFYHAMDELGLYVDDHYISECAYTNPDSAHKATLPMLNLADPPTCILFSDDYSALGGIEAIESTGLRIPRDISIAGFDGIALTQLMTPKMTTIQQDTAEIGKEAGRCLVESIENPRASMARIINIPCKLLVGETVGYVKDFAQSEIV